jgi:DNA replication protein DnaC
MLDNNTVQKLHEMKLSVMAAAFQKQLEDQAFAGMSFEERFGLIVDAEWASRKSNRLTRLIRRAAFDTPGACLEDVDYRPGRDLDKALIARLGTCNYIEDRRNIILLGASGCGKTWFACAFGNAACRNYYTVRYIRLPDLLTELAVARAEGCYRKVMEQYKKVRLLILDEWLLYPLSDADVREILEIAERRHKKGSTIFCSQYDVGGWHERLGEPTVADAICDRIVHDSYTILINGEESMRKHNGIQDEA